MFFNNCQESVHSKSYQEEAKLLLNLKYAKEAILHTEKILPLGACNVINPKVNRKEISKAQLKIYRFKSVFQDLCVNKREIEEICKIAKLYKMGNCYEQSYVAAYYLMYQKKLRKVEILSIYNGDHVFVVIGRNFNSNIDDPSSWGKKCAVCDPWGNR